MKIFWSWQSDTPGKIGRFLVRDALQEAIEQLKQTPDIEEPTAKETREALHLDHDVKGVPGSPDLARTIFEKMDASEVVIADVTLVGAIPSAEEGESRPKKLINSNVAIELGYALKSLTDKRVLMVFNEHYGRHEELPFDLRHKGGSITFTLPPGADRAQIEAEKKKLKGEFVSRLRPYLAKPAAAAPALLEGTPFSFNKAAYFQKREVLARIGVPGEDEVSFSYATESLCYLRLIPAARLQGPLKLALLKEKVAHAPLLINKRASPFSTTNHYGAIVYEPGSNPARGGAGKIEASTQLFENGEIWSVSSSLIARERGDRAEWVKLPMLHSPTFERIYYDKLRALLSFASEHLGLSPPWQVEAGFVDANGVFVFVPHDEFRGPIHKPEVIYRALINDPSRAAIDKYLLDFFSAVHDASGYERPPNLYGFPPNRPST